jgi:hypothetical protein
VSRILDLKEAIAEEKAVVDSLTRCTDAEWYEDQPDWRKGEADAGRVTRLGDIRLAMASIGDMEEEIESLL